MYFTVRTVTYFSRTFKAIYLNHTRIWYLIISYMLGRSWTFHATLIPCNRTVQSFWSNKCFGSFPRRITLNIQLILFFIAAPLTNFPKINHKDIKAVFSAQFKIWFVLADDIHNIPIKDTLQGSNWGNDPPKGGGGRFSLFNDNFFSAEGADKWELFKNFGENWVQWPIFSAAGAENVDKFRYFSEKSPNFVKVEAFIA